MSTRHHLRITVDQDDHGYSVVCDVTGGPFVARRPIGPFAEGRLALPSGKCLDADAASAVVAAALVRWTLLEEEDASRS